MPANNHRDLHWDNKAFETAMRDPASEASGKIAHDMLVKGWNGYHGRKAGGALYIELSYHFFSSAAHIHEARDDAMEAAKAQRGLSIVAGMLGKSAESNRAARKGAALFEKVLDESPKDVDALKWMMKIQRDLAENDPDPEARLRAFESGMKCLERLKGEWRQKSEWHRYCSLLHRAAAGALARKRPKAREDLKKSLKHLEQAFKKQHLVPGGKLGEGKLHREQSRVWRGLGELGKAEEAAREALLAYEECNEESQWNHYQLAKVLNDKGSKLEALKECRRAIEILEADREAHSEEDHRISFFADKVAIYDFGIYLCHELGRAEEGLSLAQRSKARAFLERLAAGPDGSGRKKVSELLPAKDIQARLSADEGFVEYHVGRHCLSLFAITKKGLTERRVPIMGKEISDMVESVHGFIKMPDNASTTPHLNAALADLSKILLEPVLSELRDSKRLYLVPSGALSDLPFSALPLEDGRPAITRWEICHLPHAALLDSRGASAGKPKLLVIANPDGTLLHAEAEGREIADLFRNSVLAVREDAVKELLRGKRAASIIHLACHGRFSPEDPAKTALMLSRDGSDGVLTVDEIETLPMESVDLVFLSCCNSGLGRRMGGDEVESMARAFLSAGAKSVIVTLWDIEDKVTRELVISFYRDLKDGKSKAEALRQAQRESLQEHPHPYHWAAFQLLGRAD